MIDFLRKHITPIGIFIVLFSIYIHNLSRSVYGGDVGDLVTAAYVGGVAHPPGYPLFTLVGFLLTRLPLGQSPAFMVGLISAFSAAGAITVIYLMIHYLVKNKIIALLTSLILAFSYLFWLYAELAEVFALHAFLTILLLFLALLYYQTKRLPYLYAVAFFAGLGLTHHHTIVLIFPSLVLLVIGNLWKALKKRKRIVPFLLGFLLLGFSIYLYVPIASAQKPPINWDNVHDVESFFHLFLRKGYGTFNAGAFTPPSFAQRIVILKTYTETLTAQLTPVVTIISILGIGALIKKQRLFGSALLLAFFLSGPVFIFYAAFPLENSFYLGISERFFLMSFAIFILFFPFGFLYIEQVLGRLFIRQVYRQLLECVFFVIPLMLCIYNFPKTNLSSVMDGDYLGIDFLSPAPKDAVIFVAGDTQVFNVWYAYYGLGVRPDLKVININNLPADTYFKGEWDAYIKKYPNKKNDKDIATQVIRDIAEKQPVLAYAEVGPIDKEKEQWIPYGLTFELVKDINISEEVFTKKTEAVYKQLHFLKIRRERTIARTNFTIMDIPEMYANAYVMTGAYYLNTYNNTQKAEEYFIKAKEVAPEFVKPYAALGIYHLYYTNDCGAARDNLEEAIILHRLDKRLHTLLYQTYTQCLQDTAGAKQVVDRFQNIFDVDFFAELEKAEKEKKKI